MRRESEMNKHAEVPIAARLAAAILGISVLEDDSEHASNQRAEAELMNQELRELEARKMDQTISSLKHAEALMMGIVKAAAQASAELMEKEAMGLGTTIVGGALRAGKKSLGGAAQAAGRLMPEGPAKKSLLGLGTKAKLVGGAAVLGTGYAGYKGMQAARDYMQSQPHGVYGKGPAIAHNINEYGYPQY